jgi:hypothetical protein
LAGSPAVASTCCRVRVRLCDWFARAAVSMAFSICSCVVAGADPPAADRACACCVCCAWPATPKEVSSCYGHSAGVHSSTETSLWWKPPVHTPAN